MQDRLLGTEVSMDLEVILGVKPYGLDGAGGIVSSREWGSPANDVQVTSGRVPLQ